ncbi:hypothetical protein EDB85DRAFT_2287875 [Lactarius pseudohatsudake]|nr:hypothetical protein EDB85DRAFT_2287875 [Lactarius pseudohatsudake]
MLGHSLESDLGALYPVQLLHLPRGRPPKPELTWLTHKDRGPGGHNPKEDARITAKAGTDSLAVKMQKIPARQMRRRKTRRPPPPIDAASRRQRQHHIRSRDVKAYPTALHAALPPRAALLFSGHGDPRSPHAGRSTNLARISDTGTWDGAML